MTATHQMVFHNIKSPRDGSISMAHIWPAATVNHLYHLNYSYMISPWNGSIQIVTSDSERIFPLDAHNFLGKSGCMYSALG